jgi:hypothetical protein
MASPHMRQKRIALRLRDAPDDSARSNNGVKSKRGEQSNSAAVVGRDAILAENDLYFGTSRPRPKCRSKPLFRSQKDRCFLWSEQPDALDVATVRVLSETA